MLDPYKEEIKKLLELKLARINILQIINAKLEKPISLTAFNYFIFHDDELLKVLKGSDSD